MLSVSVIWLASYCLFSFFTIRLTVFQVVTVVNESSTRLCYSKNVFVERGFLACGRSGICGGWVGSSLAAVCN